MRDVLVEIWFALRVTLQADPLIDYLRQLEAQGQTYVNVDDDARLLLREFYRRAQGRAHGRTAQSAVPAPASPPAQLSVQSPNAVVAVATTPSDRLDRLDQSAQVQPSQAQSGLVVSGVSQDEKMADLKRQAANWPAAQTRGSFRQTMVFSTGNTRADIMLVGEAPGFDEERLGEPFVGKAGQKLDAILKAMGTAREQVYLSNIVKFRPKMPNQTTSNRKPTPDELGIWLPFIQEEVKIVGSKVIVALGRTAAQALLGGSQSVGEMRGVFHQYEGVDLRVTYHPSYILEDGATPEKRMLWEDMLSVMELLEMPISEKQRGYFSKK